MGRRTTRNRTTHSRHDRHVSVRSKRRGELEYRRLAKLIIEYTIATEEAAAAAQHGETIIKPGNRPEEAA